MTRYALGLLFTFIAIAPGLPALAQEGRHPAAPALQAAVNASSGTLPIGSVHTTEVSHRRAEYGSVPEPFGFGPPRRGRGGFMGGGRWGGGMMGEGGFGGPGHPRPPARRWQDVDQSLQQCRRQYEEIESRRQKALDALVTAKKDYHPEQIDPSAVLAQKNMDKILGTLHETVEQARANTEEAGELLADALLTRGLWEPVLREDSTAERTPQPASPPVDWKARRAAWLKGLDRLEKDGPEGFAREVLGDGFGVLVFQSIPERLKRPGILMFRHGEGGPGGPMRRQLLENIRQNWLGRIERMERQQEELSRELQRQAKEIEQMRLIMENVLSEPGGEGNPPPPPGQPQPQQKGAPEK